MPMLCTDQNSFGPGLFGSTGGWPQSIRNLPFLVELRDAHTGVTVGDEERAVGQPGDVGRPVEVVRAAARHASLAHRLHQLAVVGEDVDLVHVVVDDPDVLLGIVGVHQDLVRSAAHLAEARAARRRQVLVVLQPLDDRLAVAIDGEDEVMTPQLVAGYGVPE